MDRETLYRKYYWECNELQLIATPEALKRAAQLQLAMGLIAMSLGYVPEA